MRLLAVSFLVAACSSAAVPDVAADDLTVVATLGPQSFAHGALTSRAPELSYAFTGSAGDIVAPDVWAAGSSKLEPTLVLLGPKGKNGHRSQIAAGAPRGDSPRHVALDGFRLPQTGSYLVVIGEAAASAGGQFTVRLWTNASHLPRQESSQVDLTLQESAAAQATVKEHVDTPHPWTDGEVDSIIAGIESQADPRVAISDAQALLWSLGITGGTAAQQARAHDAAVALIGTPAQFRSLDAGVQAYALWWLDELLFTSQPQQPAPAAVTGVIDQLVAAWPGAQLDANAPTVNAKLIGNTVYGYQAEWSASLADSDGTPVFVDYAREWFDSRGNWLGEQSDGASEPDDD